MMTTQDAWTVVIGLMTGQVIKFSNFPKDRRSFMSDVKQEVMADDFCKLINRLEKLTYRLEASVNSNANIASESVVLR